ncbi:putative aminotransferase-like, plant mobile domain-containing protein [Medicago truncatula]|uniref:Putative aminotransferase-like, plant mobile domain-containing protein n=1 Tax=Medicago truncatula TaxID=3880 RepID=A0A396IXM5_MEDTR|nr:putative aminotransferase-like, plant mobile domain-containing protein [Medicago truncatula]
MLVIRDLANIGTWPWSAIGLVFLYEQLNLTSDSNAGSVGGYMSLLMGWVIAHLRHVVPRSRYQDYERDNPFVGRWRPQMGFRHADHFRGLLDSMEHYHVTWTPYEH